MKSQLNAQKGQRVLEFFFSLIFYSPGNCVKCIVIDSSLLKSELDSKFCFCSNGVLRYLFVAWSGGQGIIILNNHWARWTLPLWKYSSPLIFFSLLFFFKFCLFSYFLSPFFFSFLLLLNWSMQGHVLVEVQALYWPLCVDIHTVITFISQHIMMILLSVKWCWLCESVRKVKRKKCRGNELEFY